MQVITGLFANDDIAFVGPLFDLVGKNLSNRLTGIHYLVSNALYVLIALHIAAIAFYGHVKKENLVRPMVTGWKEGAGESATGGGALALILALAVAGAAVYGASGAWLPARPRRRPPPKRRAGETAAALSGASRNDQANHPGALRPGSTQWPFAGKTRCR